MRAAARALPAAAWGLGTAFFAVIAGGALVRTAEAAVGLWPSWRLSALAALGVLGFVLAPRLAARGPRRAALALAALAVLGPRFAVVAWVDAPLVFDWREYHQLAVSIAEGGPWLVETRFPTGFPLLLAPFYRLFGPDPGWARVLGLLLSVSTASSLYGLTRIAWGERAGAAAVVLYGLSAPSALMSGVVGTETAYTAGVTAALYAAARTEAGAGLLGAAATGALLGLSQWVRTTSLALLPSFVLAPWLGSAPRRALQASTLVAAAFFAVLLPVIAFNHQLRGRWTPITADVGGLSLMIGTSTASGGLWNREDWEVYRTAPTLEEANRRGVARALRRLHSAPGPLARLAVRKVFTLWSEARHGVEWALGTAPTRAARVLAAVSQAEWALLLAAAAVALHRERRRRPAVAWLGLTLVATMATVHLALEVQPRYHEYFTPLFAAFAGALFAGRAGGSPEGQPAAMRAGATGAILPSGWPSSTSSAES